jgi:alkaline phosphatase D
LPGRQVEPRNEIVSLADYRLRYGSYRSDPDLQALHARLPMVCMWDDHELTNDAWTGGAQNHQPETEGPWETRKAAAIKAYREWMPTSDALWRVYRAGDLVSLHRIESRITGRDQQFQFADILKDARDPAAAVAAIEAFAKGPLADPRRQMLGAAQERWLLAELGRSVAMTRWQTLMNQVLMGSYLTPPEALSWLPAGASEFFRRRAEVGVLTARLGLPGWLDSWAGYPAARDRILRAAQARNASFVSIAGDTHNAWAFELALDGKPAGVEFGGQSVSSPGLETSGATASPAAVAEAIVRASPGLRWCDTSRRGYATVTFERDRVTANYHLLETTRARSTALAGTRAIVSERGSNRLAV